MKLVWLYLCDSCDHAGIWNVDIDLLSFQIGESVRLSEIKDAFGHKVLMVGNNKLFIQSFFDFQYGASKENFKARTSALLILEKLGIYYENGSFTLRSNFNTSPTVDGHLDKCLSIGIGKSKSKSIGKSKSMNEPKFDFEAIYSNYPRKEGKQRGIEKCKAQIKTQNDYDHLLTAIQNYKTTCKNKGTEGKYIKLFSSFMTEWRDWLDPETGSSESFAKPNGIDWDKIRKDLGV